MASIVDVVLSAPWGISADGLEHELLARPGLVEGCDEADCQLLAAWLRHLGWWLEGHPGLPEEHWHRVGSGGGRVDFGDAVVEALAGRLSVRR